MIKRVTVFLVLVMISILPLQSQNKKKITTVSHQVLQDSLKKMQDSTDYVFFSGNYYKTVDESIKNIQFAEKIGDTSAGHYSRYMLAYTHFLLKDFDKSLEIMKDYKAYALKNKDTLKLARAFNVEGSVFLEKENYNRAIEYFKKTTPLFASLQDTLQVALSYYNISEANLLSGKIESAQIYLDSTKSKIVSMNRSVGLTTELNLLEGKINLVQNNNFAAIANFKKGIEFAEAGKYYDQYYTESYKNYSEALYKTGATKDAYIIFKKYDSIRAEVFKDEKVKMIENATARFETEKFKAAAMKSRFENDLNQTKYESESRLNTILILSGVFIIVLLIFIYSIWLRKFKSKASKA